MNCLKWRFLTSTRAASYSIPGVGSKWYSSRRLASYSVLSQRLTDVVHSRQWRIYGSCAPVKFYSTSSDRLTAFQAHSSSASGTGAILDNGPIPAEGLTEHTRRVVQENLQELGLASSYTPVGWIQNLLSYLHVSTGLPWWEVIILGTCLLRTITLPIIISSQRRSASMLEHQPELQRLGRQMEDAQKSGDRLKIRMAMLEMNHFLREVHLPLMKKMMLPMVANGGVFMTYFLALRGMASKSLLSMQEEGFLWFTDLTAADPTLLLPTMCAISTMLVIEVGIEFGVSSSQIQPGMRWLMRIAPFAVLLVANHLPAAVMCYWLTSNVISLILALLLRIPVLRRVLGIPSLPPTTRTSLRESWKLPQFVRDYLSAPVILVRAANERLRKGHSKPVGGSASGKDRKHSQK